jgi:hypothetical protein
MHLDPFPPMIGDNLKPCSQTRADQGGLSAPRSADDSYETVLFDLQLEDIDCILAAKKILPVAVLERPQADKRPVKTGGDCPKLKSAFP